tara:strand:+ start:4532 stop:4657 length:126 start_codon:yes stop_codon:yes gene_type:complete
MYPGLGQGVFMVEFMLFFYRTFYRIKQSRVVERMGHPGTSQ